MVGFRQSKGLVSRQAQAKTPAGTYEDLYSRDGFAGDQTMLYRRHAPTGYTRVEGDFVPHVGDASRLRLVDATDPRALPTKLMYNQDIAVYASQRAQPMPFTYRNADGDEIIFVQAGHGVLRTDFGRLNFTKGDYLVIPKGINYQMRPESSDNMFLIVQTARPVAFPDRGVLGQYVPFDLGVLQTPEPEHTQRTDHDEWELVAKRNDRLTSFFYPFDPMDVVGWQGSIAPFKLSMYDIRSISSERLDIPPSGYATFQTPGAWICTFTPHPMQSDPDSTFVPPFHRNVDYDEVLFVLDTESDEPAPGLCPGTMLVIPQGAHHGLDQGPGIQTNRPARFGMYVINIDVERPLTLCPAFAQCAAPMRPPAAATGPGDQPVAATART